MEMSAWKISLAMRRPSKGPFIAVLRVIVLLVVILLACGFLVRQTKLLDKQLIFFPSREIAATPESVGLYYEDVTFAASDGVNLHGWFVPGRQETTLVWFHGNAGNIGDRVENLALMHHRLGISVFIFDYRGYGRSEGSPSEKGMYLDAEAALEYLGERPGEGEDNGLVYFGRSLGAAVAVEMATRHQPKALILESPFTSVGAMARRTHPLLSSFLPVGAVVQSKFDSLSKIGSVQSPVMVMHGDRDEIVPFEMGRQLFDAANEPKRFYTIENAGHNDTYLAGGDAYFDALGSFINDVMGNDG